MATAIKPPFAYFGGKTTLAPKIAELLPKHDHYVEPFAGCLAVLLAKEPSRVETVNDLDGDLMTFWRVLRDTPHELHRACELTPHGRAEYLEASEDLTGLTDLERARRVWTRLAQGRANSMAPSGWQHARSPSKPMGPHTKTLTTHMPACAERIAGVSLENRDAIDMIQDYGTEPYVCIYADPPYLGSTRNNRERYGAEMLGDDLHERLADALNECKASVVLSGYDSPLYAELFAGWHRTDLKAPTKLNGQAGAVEVLWSNVPLGQQAVFDFDTLA